MRLPYVSDPPPTTVPDETAIVDRIRTRRGSRGLTVLDRALLHSPSVADGWNSFLGSIRTKTTIPADLRELAICRVAVINEAWYEWGAHAPIAIDAGVSEDVMEGMKMGGVEGLTDKQRLVVDFTSAMTRDVKVPDDLFAQMKAAFSDREVVEITATVGAYNCVSRFLVALDVGEMNGKSASEVTTSH
ncbi:hypothetical protein MMC19_003639 [Ptychographa xylographoides]|nr:hypothetical protein [Ptychographa xylographoides]